MAQQPGVESSDDVEIDGTSSADKDVDGQSEGDEAPVAEIDWLVEEYWHEEFKDGMLTLNQEDLERFFPTGVAGGQYQVGPVKIVRRIAILLSSQDSEDSTLDVPASVVVSIDGKIVVGAKGMDFGTNVDGEMITISHWNGETGCSVSKWKLKYDLKGVEFASSVYADYITGKPCKR